MLGDLAGTTALREALSTTNTLLEQVLAELRTTNDRRLEDVVAEMRAMNAALATAGRVDHDRIRPSSNEPSVIG